MIAAGKLAVFAALAGLLVAPVVLRPQLPKASAQVRLVIISPHDSQIREEFAHAFAAYAAGNLTTSVDIDWRTVGGTGEITRYLDERYGQAFASRFPAAAATLAHEHDAKAFLSPSSDSPSASPGARAARLAFLGSDVSAGIDVWWGGGEFPHRTYANKGILVDAGLVRAEPTWFTDAVIPQRLSGETIWDAKGRYYGASLSIFGICASPDRLALLHPAGVPTQWSDLGAGRFFDVLTVVDPTRSAASASAFERLMQQQMSLQVSMLTVPASTAQSARALAQGWQAGMTLIKRIGGNARDLSDGASFAVREVVRGDVTAAMAIDFQARCEEEYAYSLSHSHRLIFTAPVGGTSVSADPISLLRGAPHRAMAVAFMHFVLSPAGQHLLDYRVGTPGGPLRTALRRMPVRKDCYSDADRQLMSDRDADPFAVAASFTYHPSWTAPYYTLLSRLTRAVVMDPRAELTAAWRAILDAGGPERVPQAWQEFCWLPFSYEQAPAMAKIFERGDVGATLPLQRAWTVDAQSHYRFAETLAREGR